MDATLEALQYPVGKFVVPMDVSEDEIRHAIHTLEAFPERMRNAVDGLSDEQMDTPYRPGGWTIRQVVHHCADSHVNAYVRFKLALTEDIPVIKPYIQDLWAELPDSRMDVAATLALLDGLHRRWAYLLKRLSAREWDRRFLHPEYEKSLMLRQVVMNYGWHCEHHLAHVLGAVRRLGRGE